MRFRQLLLACVVAAPANLYAETTEFCLDGEFDLAARYQGMHARAGEFTPMRWCVITEDRSDRALFSASGKSNPDMQGNWTVAFLPPDLVRIVNRESPPDVEFRGARSLDEARRMRRIDPRRVVEEFAANPDAGGDMFEANIVDGRLVALSALADLPLRGRVAVTWHWSWTEAGHPDLRLEVDGNVLFRASGSWRVLDDDEAAETWARTPGEDPIQAPGEHWPARVSMLLVELAEGVYLVRGVRTGFQHLVVRTAKGLVVADAPAGWVELQQIPPADLVPGLGISGLSEQFIDFLAAEFPGESIRAVALTHAHDDHSGGARAFAAVGADVYAPAGTAGFLESALSRDNMPADRLGERKVRVHAVGDKPVVLADDTRPVVLTRIGKSPHVDDSLGVSVPEQRLFFVSDLHVPRNEDDEPRDERRLTECWFASWATKNLPADTLVVNTHSAPQTPVSRLARYLESRACQVPPS